MKKTKQQKKQRKKTYLGTSLSREKQSGYSHFEKWEEELRKNPSDAIKNLKLLIEKPNGIIRLWLHDWKGRISLKPNKDFLMFLASHKLVKETRNRCRSVFYPK